MRDYWSCSKIADVMRGTPKPRWGTCTEWVQWRLNAIKKHRIRYWIVETGFDAVQDFIWWPIDTVHSIRYYYNNRWVTNSHQLTASKQHITPGQWCDVGDRFLPCMFNALVDFVEIEMAGQQLYWLEPSERARHNPPSWATRWFSARTWRSRGLGVEALKVASEITYDSDWGVNEDDENYGEPTQQAVNAVEILALYTWWVDVHPNRPDPHDLAGLSAYHAARPEENSIDFDFDTNSDEDRAEMRLLLDENYRIEQVYTTEDTNMMIRLIKARDGLWS
jgi:hypothetical protein